MFPFATRCEECGAIDHGYLPPFSYYIKFDVKIKEEGLVKGWP